jgi:HAMP domain-containing protein
MIHPTSIVAFRNELTKIAAKEDQVISDKDVKSIKRELELWNKLRKVSPVKVKKDRMAVIHGGAYFDQQAKEIGLSKKDYESLAHEIGHAELDKKILGRILQHPTARAAMGLTPLAGAAAGALAARGRKLGLLLPVATAAPTVASEMWATSRGKKKLKEIGATDKEIERYKKNLRKSFGSYLGPPVEAAATGGMTYLIAKAQ